LFLAGLAAVIALASIRIFTADHHALVLCWILGWIAWGLLAAAIYRAHFFQKPSVSRLLRMSAELLVQAALVAILLIGWRYGPWQHYPKIATLGFGSFYLQDGLGFVDVALQNQSDDEAAGSVMDYRLRLIPFNSNSTHAEYRAMETRVSKEIFDELDQSDLLKPGPVAGVGTINPWQRWVESPRTAGPTIGQTEMTEHQEGRLTVFLGGREVYSDANGCKYRTEYCGFISKAGWLLANCREHFSQGVRLPIPCHVE
jgi:hypothetical protein